MSAHQRDRRFQLLVVFLTTIIIVLVVSFVLIRTHAQELVHQSVAVQNKAPKVDSVVQSDEPNGSPTGLFFLITGKKAPLYVWGHVSDDNGCEDLHDVQVKVYRTDLGPNCELKDGLCIQVMNVPIEGCSAGFNSASYVAVVNFPYFTDPTDAGSPSEGIHWSAEVTVTDQTGNIGTGVSSDFDIASIVGMDADDHLDFGTLALGAITPPASLNILNFGNRSFDFSVQSYGDLSCTGLNSPPIPSVDLHVGVAPDATYENTIPLPVPVLESYPNYNQLSVMSDTGLVGRDVINPSLAQISYFVPQPVTLPLNVQTRLTSSGTGRAYFILRVPSEGVEGVCSGSLGITAQPN